MDDGQNHSTTTNLSEVPVEQPAENLEHEETAASAADPTQSQTDAPAKPKRKRKKLSKSEKRERRMARLEREYQDACRLGHRGRLRDLEEEMFLLDPHNKRMVADIESLIDSSGPTMVRAEYQKCAEPTLLEALEVAVRRWRNRQRQSISMILENDPLNGTAKVKEQIRKKYRNQEDRRHLEWLLHTTFERLEKNRREEIGAAKKRVGAVFYNAICAGCPVDDLPFWQVVAWSIYKSLPRTLSGWLDLRDVRDNPSRVPELWKPAIEACPQGSQLFAISYPSKIRPKVRLNHLGIAIYGVVCLAGQHLKVDQRQTLGVLLLDRYGKEVLRVGEAVGAAPKFPESNVLKDLSQAPLFAGWDFPLQYCNGDEKMKERIDSLCQRAEARGELDHFGLDFPDGHVAL